MIDLSTIPPDMPVLIAGPTASGKSGLACRIAETAGGVIVNADALQVFDNWRVLTARPSPEEETALPHRLYGHVAGCDSYSVGHWLRDIAPVLADQSTRPIIVGGTGLYFRALTEGLADIPATDPSVRHEADALSAQQGTAALAERLRTEDPMTAARIDMQNPMRVQRAWEVLRQTGRPLAEWQDDTAPPLVPLAHATPLVLMPDKGWLNARINLRFDLMLDHGALDEARANLPGWDPARLSSRAIGAPELIAHLKGDLPLAEAAKQAKIASHQYAKRQRTWFRARMRTWTTLDPSQG